MKIFIANLVLFVSFAILFSGCSGPADTAAISEQNNQNQAINAAEKKTSSEYPPLPEKVAQAEMENLDRSTSKLADRKGKVVLVNLWATWCGFCRQEMPILVKMQDEHRDAGLEIIGLNVDDESIDDVNQFVQEMKLNYTIAWADGKLTNGLLKISKFQGIPQSFLIDREGNLRGVFTGANPENLKKMEDLVASMVAE
jgi:thiol-disulfide isomerase/thioredoxin